MIRYQMMLKCSDSQVKEHSFECPPTQVGRIYENKISTHLLMIPHTAILSCFSNSASTGNLNLKEKILKCFYFIFHKTRKNNYSTFK